MWKRDIIKALVIVIVSTVLALIVNFVRTPALDAMAVKGTITDAKAYDLSGVPLIATWAENKGWTTPPTKDRGEEPAYWPIDTLTAEDFLDKGDCIFLDARGPEEFAEGHVPGARNWPSDSFDTYLETLGEEVEKEGCVVAYCIGGTCDESYHLVMSLLAEGYKEVYLYEGGIEEWQLFDLPVETGPDPSAAEESETDPE